MCHNVLVLLSSLFKNSETKTEILAQCTHSTAVGATENARTENAGLENGGQNFSQLWAKLRGLENAGLENDDHVN